MKKIPLLIFVVALAAKPCRADELVAPSDRQSAAGSNFSLTGFSSPGELQLLYGTRNFSTTSPILLTGLAFRNDENKLGLSFDAVIPRISLRMSTYGGTLASFDRFSYDANKGPDDRPVFDGAVHWTTTDRPDSSPNPFDLRLLFSTPFVYDPAIGPLLIDYQSFGPFTSSISADAHLLPILVSGGAHQMVQIPLL